MKILTLDCEHSKDIFKPWEPGFYLDCVSVWRVEKTAYGESISQEVLWFNHEGMNPDRASNFYTLQKYVDAADLIVFHNAKHDLNILRYYGVTFEHKKIHCTMITEYLLRRMQKNVGYSLNDLAERYGMPLKYDIIRKDYWDKGIDTFNIPWRLLEEYALRDVSITYSCYTIQIPLVKSAGQEKLINLHNEYILALSDMEINGFKWDKKRAAELYKEHAEKVLIIEKELHTWQDKRINFSSPIQLAAFLFGGEVEVSWKEWVMVEVKKDKATRYFEKTFKEKIKCVKLFKIPDGAQTPSGNPKTDKETIRRLSGNTKDRKRIKKLLIERSEAQKVCETIKGVRGNTGLSRKVQPDGFIHTKYNNATTGTGRLSSSDPNSQNMPRGATSPIKICVIPRGTNYVAIGEVDAKQIEWKVGAELSGDPVMIGEINNHVDQHAAACTDKQLMNLPLTKENRQNAKIFNFRWLFGGTAYGFYKDIKMPPFGIKVWERIVTSQNAKYHVFTRWGEQNLLKVERGLSLKTFTGRIFQFAKTIIQHGVKAYSPRQVKNYPVQGTAGGDLIPFVTCIIRRGMISQKMKSLMILTVHDSIVFDIYKGEVDKLAKLCLEVLENLPYYILKYWGYDCMVKVWGGEFSFGPNYGEMDEYEPT